MSGPDLVVTSTLRSALSGRYAIEREIGRGGMAAVYLARDLRHDRTVALKVLARDVVAPAGAERFLREIRIAARLTHPHVLGLHDSGDVEGLSFYVMPFVDGETLRARLTREGALPLPDAVRLLRELADALAYAHKHGVVHRDLKPENVLLSGDHAIVADFGIAKAIDSVTRERSDTGSSLTTAGLALGTPAYMAPEQAVSDGDVDHRADLYALGVIAYEMLTGAHPFGTGAPQAMLAAHLTRAPAPLTSRRAGVPAPLATLIMRLLAKDPADRPQDAEEVVRVLDGLSASPPRVSPPRRALVVGAAAVLVIAGAAAWAVSQMDRSVGRTDSLGARGAGQNGGAIRTVAVLPFENTSGNIEDDYFSDGLTDELAHALARLPGVRLAGRTSSYAFKGKPAPASEIGRALDVAAFVTGTMRRSGERIRVAVQLVSTADGKVLRDTVSESLSGDVFAVQDQLTRTIVASIAPALGTGGGVTYTMRRGTDDQAAYDFYLKGRYHYIERGADNVREAIKNFKQAIARDPSFARAHAGLALSYIVLGAYVPDPLDTASALAAASATRAVALDSTLADAQSALAVMLENQGRLVEAERHHRAAIAAEPSNVNARHWLGMLLLSLGRTEDGLAELAQAVKLDPLAKSPGSNLAWGLVMARRFDEAAAQARSVLALDSTFPLAIFALAEAQTFGGHPEEAVATLERALAGHQLLPWYSGLLVLAYASAGRWADAERVRGEMRRAAQSIPREELALAELVFGNREPLMEHLAYDGKRLRYPPGVAFGCNPLLDPMWSDARFRELMQRLSVAPCPLVRPWPLAPRPTSAERPSVDDLDPVRSRSRLRTDRGAARFTEARGASIMIALQAI